MRESAQKEECYFFSHGEDESLAWSGLNWKQPRLCLEVGLQIWGPSAHRWEDIEVIRISQSV